MSEQRDPSLTELFPTYPREMMIHWLRSRVFALASVATDDYSAVPWTEQDVVEILDHALWFLDQHLTMTSSRG